MGTWKPWLLTRGDQFRPEPPPAFDSAGFREELALLKRINSNPTPSQRAIATNFAAKSLDFVWEPGYALVRRERLSVPREVRLLAPFAALQIDAYIAAHDTKYTYWSLRPSMADYTIVPLITVPNHPAYVSNAAIIATQSRNWSAPCSRRRQPNGGTWARRPASPASTPVSTTPAMSGPATGWAKASPHWRSSAISSMGRRSGTERTDPSGARASVPTQRPFLHPCGG